jgi:YbgC/YbaW family acyl-CoA thioester hydrolase
MAREPFVYETRVRFGDTDASGRIFYAALLRHFDAAETEFIRSINWTYKGLGFPRAHVEVDFTSALAYDDPMQIAVTVDRIGTTSYTLAFHVSSDGREAARGKIVVVSIDRTTGRPVPLPEQLRAALSA